MTKNQVAELIKTIRPLCEPVWQCDYHLGYLSQGLGMLAKDYGALNMTPDFQRGHVWTPEQQLRFCEAYVRKFIPQHLLVIQFNAPYWNSEKPETDLPREIQCVDGLQRLTALQKMMAGEILPFGVPIRIFDGTSLQLSRISRSLKIQVHAFTKKRDLLQYYLDINEGATPHTPEELTRVRQLLASV